MELGTFNNKPAPPASWATKVMRRVSSIFSLGGTQHVPVVRPQDTIAESYHPYSGNDSGALSQTWRVAEDRKNTLLELDRMDSEDEFVAAALDIIADCSIAYTDNEHAYLRVNSKDPEVEKILKDLIERLDLKNEVWQITRDMVKHAEHYREVILDPSRTKIIALKQTITYEIWPNLNRKQCKIPGWIYRTDHDIKLNLPGTVMEEWQIAPFFFGNRIGNHYVPILASARRNWNRLQKMEDGMAIARLTRAYDKWVHKVPVKANDNEAQVQAKIRNYINNIGKKKIIGSEGTMNAHASPFDVDTDFYLADVGSGQGGIDVLSGSNSSLSNLNDYFVLRERLLARMSVPIAYLQIMSTQKTHLRAGGMLSDVDVQFARRLRFIQSCLRRGLRRVCDFELKLHGIMPTADLYELELTAIVTKDLVQESKIALTNAQASVYFLEAFGALPLDLLSDKFMHLTTEQQEVMGKFLESNQKRLETARVKAQELAAQPKNDLKDRIVGNNKNKSGNQNKSRAERSSEQRGAVQAIVELDAAVEAFFAMHQQFVEDPDHQITKDQVREELLAIVEGGIKLNEEEF